MQIKCVKGMNNIKEIIIYGLGVYGKNLARQLLVNQQILDIHVIVCMDKNSIDSDFEYEIGRPEQLESLSYDYIMITSEKWFDDIKRDLVDNYHVKEEKIIHLSTLIKREGKYYCNLCNEKVPLMLDFGYESPIFVKHKIVGGGKREKCICPICGGIDRERWLQFILSEEVHIYDKKATVLHFAPERQIEKKLRNCDNLTYITADIEVGRDDRVEDITNISFSDETFDYIICNHILEHILDERKAFAELKRCIKKNGKIIFSVPICWEIDTLEDERIASKQDKLLMYGQEDHVRLYGKDIVSRLEQNGFEYQYYQVSKVMSVEKMTKMNLLSDDAIWILEKKDK